MEIDGERDGMREKESGETEGGGAQCSIKSKGGEEGEKDKRLEREKNCQWRRQTEIKRWDEKKKRRRMMENETFK